MTPEEIKGRIFAIEVPTTPFMAIVCLQSEDLGKTQHFLSDAAISITKLSDHALLVNSQDAAGASIIIFDKEEVWPPGD